MAKFATILTAGLAVFVLIIASVSGTNTTAAAPAADRCLPCHPRAHVDNWRDSHVTVLAADPQQEASCTRCHPTSFCVECHQQSAAGGTSSGQLSAEQLVGSLCSGCHSLSAVQGARKDKTGWASTIDRMTKHGLAADDSQKAAILEYLSAQYGQ